MSHLRVPRPFLQIQTTPTTPIMICYHNDPLGTFCQYINLYLHTGNDIKKNWYLIFDLAASSYSSLHPSDACASHPTPPSPSPSHISREVSLRLFPGALLLCHQVTP